MADSNQPHPSVSDRLLQWGTQNIAGPIAPQLSNQYQQEAQANALLAHQQQLARGQSTNAFSNFGHGLASLGYEALGVEDKMVGGLLGMNPGQALLSAVHPQLAGAVMASQAAPSFWQQAKDTFHNPTPDNVQNFLLGAGMMSGAAAGAGSPTGPVGAISHEVVPSSVEPTIEPVAQPLHLTQTAQVRVSPKMYLNKIGAGDPSSVLLNEADQATVNHFRQQIRSGAPIDPVSISHDTEGNVIDADGRHRALAAHLEGVDRIPVTMQRALPALNNDPQSIALSALQDRHLSDPRLAAHQADYGRIQNALKELHGNDSTKLDALQASLQPQ